MVVALHHEVQQTQQGEFYCILFYGILGASVGLNRALPRYVCALRGGAQTDSRGPCKCRIIECLRPRGDAQTGRSARCNHRINNDRLFIAISMSELVYYWAESEFELISQCLYFVKHNVMRFLEFRFCSYNCFLFLLYPLNILSDVYNCASVKQDRDIISQIFTHQHRKRIDKGRLPFFVLQV